MRRIRYSVAMSLDGFIADEEGGYDWIPMDPSVDFPRYLAKIDTLLMGRRTYETAAASPEGRSVFAGMEVLVVSSTLQEGADPEVRVIRGDPVEEVGRLKRLEGRKDIWLFGGGILFRSLLEAGLVDRVEVAVVPVLLGSGLAVLPGLHGVAPLELHSSEAFGSGIVLLKYDVAPT